MKLLKDNLHNLLPKKSSIVVWCILLFIYVIYVIQEL
jgi:hypothetical protein